MKAFMKYALATLFAAWVIAQAGDSLATSMRIAPIPELAGLADAVVVGEVTGQNESRWHSTRILTHRPFKITSVWKGTVQTGETVTVTTLGGVVGEYGQVVHGVPTFKTGQRYVLFLSKDKSGDYRVTGMLQGAFAIVDSPTGETVIRDSLHKNSQSMETEFGLSQLRELVLSATQDD